MSEMIPVWKSSSKTANKFLNEECNMKEIEIPDFFFFGQIMLYSLL